MSTLTKFSAIPDTGPAPTNREPYVAIDGPAADARGAAIAATLQHPGMTQELGQDIPSFLVDKDEIVGVLRTLKENSELAFTMPLDLFGVDYPKRASGRFDVIYQLYSLKNNERIRLKVRVADGESIETGTPSPSASE